MEQLHESCIREIKFSVEIAKHYKTLSGIGYLDNITRLNVFIGPNNGGKSRLLRGLFQDVDGLFSTSRHPESAVREARLAARRALDFMLPRATNGGRHVDTLRAADSRLMPLWRKWGPHQYGAHMDKANRLNTDELGSHPAGWLTSHIPIDAAREHLNSVASYFTQHTSPANQNYDQLNIHRVYVPALRSMHRLDPGDFDIPQFPAIRRTAIRNWFEQDSRFKDEVSRNGHGEEFDEMDTSLITGGELYAILRSRLLGDSHERQRIRDFETYLGDYFFGGRAVSLIPKRKSSVPWVKIGDDDERPVYHLGDGIQQIIIMTLPLFLFADRPLLLFIEEPELYLHPGFQRAFIDRCLKPLHQQHQIFVATHSHQFIDITVDRDLCTVFRVSKDSVGADKDTRQFTISESSTHDFELLRLLGVRNSSVMLSNCTIWVEGITDRLYFRKYLRLYQKHLDETKQPHPRFLEDLHYSFVEYGGSNVVHWSFLDNEEGIDVERVCGNLMLIADQDHPKRDDDDTEKSFKKGRHDRLAESLGNRFILLECREVENLLMPPVIEKIIRHYEKETPEIPAFEYESYKTRPLGDYLETLLPARTRKGSYSDGGPVSEKMRFCELACDALTSWDQLSAEAKRITAQIHQFISDNNHQPVAIALHHDELT